MLPPHSYPQCLTHPPYQHHRYLQRVPTLSSTKPSDMDSLPTTIRLQWPTTPIIKSTLLAFVAPDIPDDEPAIFSSANNFVAGPTPINDPSSPSTVVKHEDSFGYDHNMALDRGIDPSMSTYQPMTGYAPQERNPLAFDYPVHPNTVSSLANMLTGSAPFATVAPSATSGLPDEDASAYNLSAEIAELSISSPASSTIFHAGSLSSSSSLIPIFQPQTPVCDPKTLDSPVIMEQTTMEAGPSNQPEGSRRSRTSFYRASTADSDYAPSGESEVDDKNDGSYGKPLTRKKARSARVAHAAHPYLKPAPKAKGNARRGTKLELPVPVPGLTKNSRGRTVPKKTESTFEDVSRPFWCHVEDCDKLFSRGEHLKRHISSIHTDDKREKPPTSFLASFH